MTSRSTVSCRHKRLSLLRTLESLSQRPWSGRNSARGCSESRLLLSNKCHHPILGFQHAFSWAREALVLLLFIRVRLIVVGTPQPSCVIAPEWKYRVCASALTKEGERNYRYSLLSCSLTLSVQKEHRHRHHYRRFTVRNKVCLLCTNFN